MPGTVVLLAVRTAELRHVGAVIFGAIAETVKVKAEFHRRLAKFFRAFLNVVALPERILDHVCEARRLKGEDGKRMELDVLLSLPDILLNFEGIRDLLNESLVWTEEKHVQWLNHSGGASFFTLS